MIKPNYKKSELRRTHPTVCDTCGKRHDRQTVCLIGGAEEMLTELWRSMELLTD